MSFCRDCYDSVRGNVRNFMSTPLSRQKLYIFGGVFIALLLLVIILAVTLHSGSSGESPQGSSVLNDGPAGSSNINPSILKNYVVKGLSGNETEISNTFKLSNFTSSHLLTTIWPAGASSCGANQKDATAQTLEIIDIVNRVVQKLPEKLALVSDSQDLSNAKYNGKIGVVISLDGGYTIDSRLAVLRTFKTLGASVFTLTGPCPVPWLLNTTDDKESTNLTEFGMQIVTEATRLGLLLDLTYSSTTVVKTVINSTAPAVIFSGVGAKNLTQNDANLGDETLGLIKDKGVVMVGFDCDRIKSKDYCTMDDVIKHLNYIAEKAGKKAVGLSFNFTSQSLPSDLKSLQDVATLFDKLKNANSWSLDDLRGLAFDNFLNKWKMASDYANTQKSVSPIDSLEKYTELDSSGKTKLECYSDLNIRYDTNPTTAPPTAQPTTVTAAPTTVAPTVPTKSP